VAILTDELLQHTARRAFRLRETTLDDAAAEIPVVDFAETMTALRERIHRALLELPESAFTDQQAGEGEQVWAAGQVVAHLANSLQAMRPYVDRLLDVETAEEPRMLDMSELPSRTQAVRILERSTPELQRFLAGIPQHADFDRRDEHPRFGSMGIKGWLIMIALHEEGHLRQLQALRAPSGAGAS
jgi:hypothetical protein